MAAARMLRRCPVVERLECRLAPAVVNVDAAAGLHAIDPNIYGVAFASTAQLDDLNLTLNRYGGNTSTRYNWQLNLDNKGSDWFFESLPDGPATPGQYGDSFITDTLAGGALPMLTIPMIDYVAWTNAARQRHSSFSVAKYGPQQATDSWMPDAGNGKWPDGSHITGNDPLDASTPNSVALQQGWINHLLNEWGNSSNGGVRYYFMDNEPALWWKTHRDVAPTGITHTQLRDKFISYASMVKQLDPNAQILGPEEWGWTNYFISGFHSQQADWGAQYDGMALMPWYLNQLRLNHQATGQRLMDYFTLHYYPQSDEFRDFNNVSNAMQLLRNQSTRSLWDPNYVDQSWIASTGINGGRVNLINMMQSWVDTYYPGTKIGITEYNWGAEGHMNGATAQADIWGIFGREGLDLANRWTTPDTDSPAYLAMKMFRNYDGNGSAFGGTSVQASVGNPDQVSAFASLRGSDGALTVMVINKNLATTPGATTSVTVNLGNFDSTGVAKSWRLAATNAALTQASITQLNDISFAGDSFTLNVPNQSVQIFVLSPAGSTAPATPTGLGASGGDAQAVLTWNAATGATSYSIYRSTVSGGQGAPIQTGVTGTSFTDVGLTNGTTYYYKVSAVNGAGESALSSEASALPQEPAAFSVFVNFTKATGEVAAGYVADSGAAFGDRGNGFQYGWNKVNTRAVDRDAANSPSEAHDSFARTQKPGRFWEIAVPNGTYQVHLAAGDPKFQTAVFKIKVEDVLAISGRPGRNRRWIENRVTVTVSDGRLTIRNAKNASNNKLNFVEITAAAAPLASLASFDTAIARALLRPARPLGEKEVTTPELPAHWATSPGDDSGPVKDRVAIPAERRSWVAHRSHGSRSVLDGMAIFRDPLDD
jgi:hypothetical protein